MEESDKAMALKKSYAKIILNTAKESAARVMISDRKSALLQHDLCGTKDEALRLLVRLKQMIDAKTIEAEIKSSNQQQQIDVLEAQLQEAEDIITDLRSELRWVRDKLEKAKVNELLAQNVVNKEAETVSTQKGDSEVVVASLCHNNQEADDTCFTITSGSLLNKSLLHDVECGNEGKQLDELSVTSLKLELSRKGCTQRIHALERKSSSTPNEEERCTTKKDSDENLCSGDTRSLVLALRSSNAEVIPMPLNALGIKKTSKSHKVQGRRKRRLGKRKATSVRSQTQCQVIKPCRSQSDLPSSKTSIENPTDHLVDAYQESDSVNVEADIPGMETKINTSGSTRATLVGVNATNRSTDKDLRSRKDDVLVKCDGEEDDVVVPSTKMDSNLMKTISTVVSDEISECPRTVGNRLLKYTFQRKRKREKKENNQQDPIEST